MCCDASLENIKSISFGDSHALALDEEGCIWARGNGRMKVNSPAW